MLAEFSIQIFLCRAEKLPQAAMPLAVYLSNVANGRTMEWVINQQEVGVYYGANRVTVGRWMKELIELGWVTDVTYHGPAGVRGKLGRMYGKTDQNTKAMRLYWVIFGRRLNREERKLVNRVGTDEIALMAWRKACGEWKDADANPMNVEGLVAKWQTLDSAARVFGSERSGELSLGAGERRQETGVRRRGQRDWGQVES